MSEQHGDPSAPADTPDDFFGAECLSTEELLGFVRTSLSVEEEARVLEHIEWCSLCAAELAEHSNSATEVETAPAAASSAPPAALAARFWAALRAIRIAIPDALRVVPENALAADSASEQEDGSEDGGVHWEAKLWGETFHVTLTTRWRELTNLVVAVTVDGVAISGTNELPHRELQPTHDGGARAELFLRRSHLEARARELGASTAAWELGFAPSTHVTLSG